MANKFGIEPLTPAYGRDYKSIEEVKGDWFGGKDFRTSFGQYCSIRDFGDDFYPLRFRFDRLEQTDFIKSKEDK